MPRDPTDLPLRYGQMGRSVRQLDQAFDHLSKTGSLTARDLTSLARIVPAITSPIGLLTVAVGAATIGAVKFYQAWKNLAESDVKIQLEQMGKAAEVAAKGWQTLYTSIGAGDTEKVAKLKSGLAESQALFEQHQKDVEARVAAARAEEKTILTSIDREGERLQKLRNDPYQTGTAIQIQQAKVDGLQKEYHAHEQLIQGEYKGLKAEADLLGLKAQFTEGSIRAANATTSQAKSQKELNEELERAAQDIRDLFAFTQQGGAQGPAMAFGEGALGTMGESIVEAQKQRAEQIAEEMQAVKDTADEYSSVLVGAFDAYNAALDKTISMNNLFSESTGRAFRNSQAQVLRGMGQMAEVHLAEELAFAASTAFSPAQAALYGPPASHLAAAGKWAAVAALAGVGAGALSVAPGGGGGGAVGVGGMGQPPVNQQITIIGTLDQRDLESLSSQLNAAVNSRSL